MSAPQASSTLAAEALSSSASSKCSTVINSCRLLRASRKALFSVCSRSLFSMYLPDGPLVCFLCFTHQRMLMLPRVSINLLCTRFCYITRVYPTYSRSLSVYCQHYLCRPFRGHSEILLENLDYKVHGCEIIIDQNDTIHRRWLQFCFGWCHCYRSIVVLFQRVIVFL